MVHFSAFGHFGAYLVNLVHLGLLAALRPAVLGLLVWMVLDLLPSSVDSWHTGLIAVASVAALYFLKLHPGWLILMAGAVGAFIYAPR